ncbi:Serine/threonine-protein phosphatase 7 long form [Glycine soja]
MQRIIPLVVVGNYPTGGGGKTLQSTTILMASSSSSSLNIKIKSSPVDGDEEDRKLHIRRVVPTYQGQEQIPNEIIPLLRQSDFYWIMNMGYLKINAALISALIERWRPKTHTFHMRCGGCTITLQDVSVLLGVKPEEGELQSSLIKLSWLAQHFQELNNHDGNLQQVERFTRAWILRFIRGVLFVDKGSSKVSLRYLQFLRDFRECSTYAWGAVVLAYLYREMCSATDYKICVGALHSKCYVSVFSNLFSWKCSVVRGGATNLFPKCNNQFYGVLRNPFNIHGITLKGKHDENWGQLLGPMINQWDNRVDFRVNEGLLSFNSDYMVWYRRKTKMFVDPKNASTTTLRHDSTWSPQGRTWTLDDLVSYVERITILSKEQGRITEPLSHGPTIEHEFQAQDFNILQSSVENQGIARQREAVEAEPYLYPQMVERGHGMYYTLPTFSQYSAQMYQYPFQGHQSDTSASEYSLGGAAETYPNFPWPTMTPSQ